MTDWKNFDVRFLFSMSKSPRGQILKRFHWIGSGFIRGDFFSKKQISSWGYVALLEALSFDGVLTKIFSDLLIGISSRKLSEYWFKNL